MSSLSRQNRQWQRDQQDLRAIQPDAGCYNDVSTYSVTISNDSLHLECAFVCVWLCVCGCVCTPLFERGMCLMCLCVCAHTQLVPPIGMLNNPMNAVTTKFVRTSTNKVKCPVFVIRVRDGPLPFPVCMYVHVCMYVCMHVCLIWLPLTLLILPGGTPHSVFLLIFRTC